MLSVYVIVFDILTCNFDDLKLGHPRSSKVNGHGANWKPIGGFLYDLHCVQYCISHGI